MNIYGDFYTYKIVSEEEIDFMQDDYIKWNGYNLLDVLEFSSDLFIDCDEEMKIRDLHGCKHIVKIGDCITRRKYE